MTDIKTTRLSKIAREFNVGISTIVDFLNNKGVKIKSDPNTKVTPDQYEMLLKEYSSDLDVKKESERVTLKHLREKQESISINDVRDEQDKDVQEEMDEVFIKDTSSSSGQYETDTEKLVEKGQQININVVGKIDVDEQVKQKKSAVEKVKEEEIAEVSKEKPATEPEQPESPETAKSKAEAGVEDSISTADKVEEDVIIRPEKKEVEVKVLGKIDLESMNQRTRPPKKTKEQKDAERKAKLEEKKSSAKKAIAKKSAEAREPEEEYIEKKDAKPGKKVEYVSPDDVDATAKEDKEAGAEDSLTADKKKKRKRIRKEKELVTFEKDKEEKQVEDLQKGKQKKKKKKVVFKHEISEEDVQKQIKDTLARLTTKGKSKGAKYRREKREAISQKMQEEIEKQEQDKNVIKVTEFVTVNELANMMNVPVNDVISACMSLGLFVSINQRLDAETMALVADEFNYKFEFTSVDIQEAIAEEEKDEGEDLESRPPIVTVMGHVDHGKTKLLDYIRNTNVIGGEAGGITQHIGAYSVKLDGDKQITFLDTPGHEAFTAMRARGAQITDVAIIVIAADDGIKPQTVEAINHAQAAGVPMIFAINKIDKPTANAEKIKEELANMKILVEDWGGNFQSQEISAKSGINIDELLEKVLLEAELLELVANPNKRAVGTVIESELDKGRGYIATVLVQGGTLRVGDIVLAGIHSGKIKSMYNERGKQIKEAGPATPALILGLDGAPQAGDKFNVMKSEKEVKEIANKREQLQREQDLRTQKHITLDEIGRRIAIGNFQELNIIVKGDVDGSIEALSDALIKLSTEEIQVNIIHKAVGQISEGDILLAAASNAIIVGFQVRPSMQARKIAEKEEIDIRLYSIIYDAINEIKAAMEGMLSPEIKEEIVATLEISEVFKISKIGTVAGCMVKEGKIKRDTKVRVIREGIVVYTGELGSLRRFKEDVKEVASGLECGLNIENYNDIKVGDIIEGYEVIEIKKKL
ncbi:MAG: translation initiation factor IF-2 [Bacteroidales bacterium]|nr:MAG: translation initiation factor IF-2 [Bacteroidales bacterium]